MIKTYVDNNANVVIKIKLESLLHLVEEILLKNDYKIEDKYKFIDLYLEKLTDDSMGFSIIDKAFRETAEEISWRKTNDKTRT